MLKLMNRITRVNIFAHGGALGASLVYFLWVKARLDASYAASKHPVDHLTGQTAFSAEVIKGYYAHMQGHGTLGIYQRAQVIDFGFILGMLLVGVLLGTFIARFAREGSAARRAALLAGLAMIGAAICDSIENLISFAMLADPQGFAGWIALAYSGFAVVKFALVALAILLALSAFVLTIAQRLRGSVK